MHSQSGPYQSDPGCCCCSKRRSNVLQWATSIDHARSYNNTSVFIYSPANDDNGTNGVIIDGQIGGFEFIE